VLPALLDLSPHLQALIVTRSLPTTHILIPTLSISLPAVEAHGNPPNHFLRLGLLQPLGGGSKALDAIALIDPDGKRRLMLPFGWGVGKYVTDAVGGKLVQDRYLELLRKGITEIEEERRKAGIDFYEIAKTYF
jgi:hypothetical protein